MRPALCWLAGSLSSTPLVQGIIGAHLQRVSAQAALQQRSPSLDLQRQQGRRAAALRRQSASAALRLGPLKSLKSGSWSQVGGPVPVAAWAANADLAELPAQTFHHEVLHSGSCLFKGGSPS